MRTRDSADDREGFLTMPRSRGAISGVLLILLGVWGAIIPFVGPLFGFSFTPDTAWEWTAARGWLEVLPGAAAILGGLILIGSGSRASALLGAWLAAAAGAWFVIGRTLADPWGIGDVGVPTGTGSGMRALEELAFFSLLGVVIVFLAAAAQGRVSVRGRRPVGAAPAGGPHTHVPMGGVGAEHPDEVQQRPGAHEYGPAQGQQGPGR
ncbi:hypothetical protein [Tomitella fengzijianii]|uniref:Secreted protein n=1 Tax=Tomitella fengzijianii TaxID=2597660 RepID=A0A516X1U6_9ACTN|nr:hypothetical protein [Tomitella fengzijianii]QDQ97048.1 hypothetical protein FO059_06510 [Tomitella fengzijianii]